MLAFSPPCCSHKTFPVDKFGEQVQRQRLWGLLLLLLWVFFFYTLTLSINSHFPSLQSLSRNSLVFTFKAVLSVNSTEPAKLSLRHLLRISQAAQKKIRRGRREADRKDGGLSLVEIIRDRKRWGRQWETESEGQEVNGDRDTKHLKETQLLFLWNALICGKWDYTSSSIHLHAAFSFSAFKLIRPHPSLIFSSLFPSPLPRPPSLQACSQWFVFWSAKLCVWDVGQVQSMMDVVLIEINYIPNEAVNSPRVLATTVWTTA